MKPISLLITLTLIVFSIIFSSCSDKDISQRGFSYTVLDTVHISRNGFGAILSYNIIIKIKGSNYYNSAIMEPDGTVSEIDRKLKMKSKSFKEELNGKQ